MLEQMACPTQSDSENRLYGRVAPCGTMENRFSGDRGSRAPGWNACGLFSHFTRYTKRHALVCSMILALLVVVSLFAIPASAIEIATGSMLGPRYKSDRFYVRGSQGSTWQLTYSGPAYRRQARGKLMLLRLAQSLFDDESLEGHRFDPDLNTQQVIDALDFYKQHGVLAISVGLQGDSPRDNERINSVSGGESGKPGGKKGASVSAFRSDGSLKPGWLNRLERLLTAANERGMMVCLVYFHPGQDEIFESPNVIPTAAKNITDWLIEKNFRNVVINVADEWDLDGRSWGHARFIPDNIDRFVELIRERFNHADYTLAIGAASSGNMRYPDSLAQVCDVVLLHGNGRTPGEKLGRLRQFQATKRALWMVQDDNGQETTLANLAREKASADALFRDGAGWGFTPWKQSHRFPFSYLPEPGSEFGDDTAEARRDGAYFRAVLEHVATLVMKKPPSSIDLKKNDLKKNKQGR
jgi:hypothetical protein